MRIKKQMGKDHKEKKQLKEDIQAEKNAVYDDCQKDVRKDARRAFGTPPFAYTSLCPDPYYRR